MKSKHVQDAIAYAMATVNKKRVAGRLEILACQRFLDDLERDDLIFDEAAADRVCNFAGNLKHVKGKWATKRENFILGPWQCFIYCNLFGFKRIDEEIRRFRTGYVECSRKQGKTMMVVPIAHYMTFADGEEGAETFFAATTEHQAKIAYRMAVQMCRRDPEFRKYFDLDIGKSADLPMRVSQRSTGSFMEPTIGQGETLDGSSPHCAIVDELHAHPTSAVYDVLMSGMGARDQPLLIAITTAGFDQSGVCYSQRGYIKDILEGHVKDDSTFGVIYTIDEDDDPFDEDVWPKSNPNLGVSVNMSYLREQAAQAKAVPSKRNGFLTKNVNIWTNASVAWMDMQRWQKCRAPGLAITDFADWDAYVGVDMATKKDLAAVVILFEKEGQFAVFPTFFLPEDRANDRGHRNHARYKGWADEGLLTLTDGSVTDQSVIEDHIIWLCDSFNVIEVGYDPYEATNMAVRLLNGEDSIPMVEVAQNTRQMSEPAKRLEELVLEGRLMHDHDVLSWTVSNCVAKEDVNENILVKKEKGQEEKKIDGAVATIIALNRYISNQHEPFAYEDRGIRVLSF